MSCAMFVESKFYQHLTKRHEMNFESHLNHVTCMRQERTNWRLSLNDGGLDLHEKLIRCPIRSLVAVLSTALSARGYQDPLSHNRETFIVSACSKHHVSTDLDQYSIASPQEMQPPFFGKIPLKFIKKQMNLWKNHSVDDESRPLSGRLCQAAFNLPLFLKHEFQKGLKRAVLATGYVNVLEFLAGLFEQTNVFGYTPLTRIMHCQHESVFYASVRVRLVQY